MDIRNFLISKKEKEKHKDKSDYQLAEYKKNVMSYQKHIKKVYDNGVIDDSEYKYLLNLQRNDENKMGISRFITICKKIQKVGKLSNFRDICNKIFADSILKTVDFDNLDLTQTDAVQGDIMKIYDFTKDQRKAIKKLADFLFIHDAFGYGLYGYAGTGKTTLLTELLYFLIKNKYVKQVAFTAPTNKAVDVMKGKFKKHLQLILQDYGILEMMSFSDQIDAIEENGTIIHFMTTQKILGYTSDFNTEGDKTFVKGSSNKFMKYDIVVIDEVSMIPHDIINQIYADVEYKQKCSMDDIHVPKILFVGDPAQLPPVNENSSIMFSHVKGVANKNTNSKKTINAKENKLRDKIKDQGHFVLKEIIRSTKPNLVGLCNDIRKWVTREKVKLEICEHVGDGVNVFFYNREGKRNTKWIKKFLGMIQDKKNNEFSDIILTWTVLQSKEYNDLARKIIFKGKKINEYEVGDILIMGDFYNIADDNQKANKQSSFYTSEQIKVTDIGDKEHKLTKFDKNDIVSRLKLKEKTVVINIVILTINKLNEIVKGKKYHVWDIDASRLLDVEQKDTVPDCFRIMTIKKESKTEHKRDMDKCRDLIKGLRYELIKSFPTRNKVIDKNVMGILWKEWYSIFSKPFANVNYGYAITTHKSQGSTYYNVFVDLVDMFNNPNKNEMRRCIYTGITRASNAVYVLV
jgi:DNA replication protein DnaC